MSVAANSQPTLTWASLVTDAFAAAEALHEALITCQRLPGPGSVPTRYSWDTGSMLEHVGTVEATAEKLAAQTAKAKQLHTEMVKAFEVIAPLLEIAITSQYQLPPLTLPAVAHFTDWFGDNHTPGGEYQFATEALGRVFVRTERLRWGLPSHFLAASEAITTPKEARDATQAEIVTQYQLRTASQSYFEAWQAEVSQRISRERAMCRQAIMQGAAQFLPSPSVSVAVAKDDDRNNTLTDGPQPGGYWSHDGRLSETRLEGVPQRIVEHLWSEKTHFARYDDPDFVVAVRLDHADVFDQYSVKRHQPAINRFFDRNGIPLWFCANLFECGLIDPADKRSNRLKKS